MGRLDEFVKMAEENPEEAFRVFMSPGFRSVVAEAGKDAPRLTLLLRGLAVPGCREEAMEEFLLAAGLKTPVSLAVDQAELAFTDVSETRMERITLRREGWGRVLVRLEAEGNFIELMKHTLTDRDFVGRTAGIGFVIRRDLLGQGTRRGRILIHLPGGTVETKISACAGKEGAVPERLMADRMLRHIVSILVDWKTGAVTDGQLAKKLEPPAERLCAVRPERSTQAALLMAFADGISGRYAEERRMLLKAVPRGEDGEAVPVVREFLLQVAGITEEDRGALEEDAKRLRKHRPGDYLAYALSTRVSGELRSWPARRLREAGELFREGSRSPLLYAEVLMEYREDPLLMTRLDPLSLQVLLFGMRRGLLTENLLLRAAYLSENEKGFRGGLFRVLASGYHAFPSDALLTAAVRLLLLDEGEDGKYFPWYERAVERDIRLRGLYERYVATLPENRTAVFPLVIRIYFMYNQTIPDRVRAVFYANIARNREADPDTFAAYRGRMAAFAVKCLKAGEISGELAVICLAVRPPMEDVRSAETMVKLLFTERFYCDDPEITQVRVIHPQLLGELVFPLRDGSGFIRRVTGDALILLENREGTRYAVSREYLTEPLLKDREFRDRCREQCPGNAELLLERAEECAAQKTGDAEAFHLWKRIAEHGGFSDSYRREARKKILGCLSRHPEYGSFTARTPWETLSLYAEADGRSLVSVLMDENLNRQAFRVASFVGYGRLDPALLARLAGRVIRETEAVWDEEVLSCAAYVFWKDRYDECVLEYLVSFYEGSLPEMLRLRERAVSFLLDTEVLDERLLTASLMSRTRIPEGPEILKTLVKQGRRHDLTKSWTEFYCDRILHEGIGHGEKPDASAAWCMRRLLEEEGVRADLGVKLAWLLYASGLPALEGPERLLTEQLLQESRQRNLCFGFYRNFPEEMVRMFRLRGRVFVECTADPGDEVTISYRIEGEGLSEPLAGAWRREPLPRRFRGIYSRGFTLFGGEKLVYGLSFEHGGLVTEGGRREITSSEQEGGGSSRYQRINRMLDASRKGKMEDLEEQMDSYLRACGAAEKLFTLEGGL